MPILKTIANTLTISRFIIGFIIASIGNIQRKLGLKNAILWLILAWITDVLDGYLARTSKMPEDFIGKHDIYADMTVSAGVLYFLTISNFISWKFTLIFVITAVFLIWYLKEKAVTDGIQAVPYALIIYTSLKYDPSYGYLIIAYLLFLIFITWPRFPKEKVPEFINGIRNIFKK